MIPTTFIKLALVAVFAADSASAEWCSRNSKAAIWPCCWRDASAKARQTVDGNPERHVDTWGDMCSEATKATCGADCCDHTTGWGRSCPSRD